MASDAQDRNLPASARKLQRAREQGQVPRSRELGHAFAFAIGGACLVAGAQPLADALREAMVQGLRFDLDTATQPRAMLERLHELTPWLLWVAMPLGLVLALAGLLAGMVVGGWNFTLKPLMPAFGKLNPIAGLGRMVSPAQLGDMLKSCGVALVLGLVGGWYLNARADSFQTLAHMAPVAALQSLGSVMVAGLTLLVVALVVLAVIDVPLQRFMFMQRQKMSHQEAKQEHKELEGNAEVKGRVRARMREISRRRMLAAVPKADLVVMNPTHYAVALKYDEATMAAPRVVAKGADLMALRIRDMAKDAKVPVLQMPPLARALYTHVDIDREIPAALFSAVAQVLTYVYQLRAAMAGQAPMPAEPADANVPPDLDPANRREAGAEVPA